MNIFVLTTGRSGSVTFSKACEHITNYSVGHETRTGRLGGDRFNYPKDHIEVDCRLAWLLGRLDRHYGNDALYVHLRRDDKDTARSKAKRLGNGIMRAYGRTGVLMGVPEGDPYTIGLDFCDTVNSNIQFFLRDKNNWMPFQLERAKEDFEVFWSKIGAKGSFAKAVKEFDICYNQSGGSKR